MTAEYEIQLEGASIEPAELATEELQRLASVTPASRVDRVMGHLDSLTMSTRTCLLNLPDGTALRGTVGPSVDLSQLKSFLGLDVIVEGTVAFHPSGRPQQINVDYAAVAQSRDALWGRTPHGERPGEQPAFSTGGIGPLFGQWPWDESDERIFAALRALS